VWNEAIARWQGELAGLNEMERADKEVDLGMREVSKAENMVLHQEEILARPKREWFQTEKEKTAAQEKKEAVETKKREKKLKKKLQRESEKKQDTTKKEGWIPEEQMSKVRTRVFCLTVVEFVCFCADSGRASQESSRAGAREEKEEGSRAGKGIAGIPRGAGREKSQDQERARTGGGFVVVVLVLFCI
jgi:hypothetical protein